MKILIVNKYDNSGGASIASKRLYESLKSKNCDVNFLVQEATLDYSISTTKSLYKKKLNFLRFSLERLKVLLNIQNKENLFFFDTASYGEDISNLEIVKNADIIHLHWINFGFLSLKSIKNLIKLNKPIIWTLHDMWALTGGCFHSRGCDKYMTDCNDCKYLKKRSKIAKKLHHKKIKLFQNNNIHPIAISSWSKKNIENAIVFKNKPIVIGNAINTDFFRPENKLQTKLKLELNTDKLHIGFIAFNITNKFKGGKYLFEALSIIEKNNIDLYQRIELIAIGRVKDKTFFPDNLNVHFAGYISNENVMLDYYNAMDLFVLPSLEENLPLVIQEAMACETPVVAYDTGGISDMIEHNQNGYLAKYKDSNDLANGIVKLLTDKVFIKHCSEQARSKIVDKYSYGVISDNLLNLYNELLIKKQ